MKGVNALLYSERNEPSAMMTAQEVMDALHIKDRRTLTKLFKSGLPHMRVGKEYIVSVKAFNKWVEDNTIVEG